MTLMSVKCSVGPAAEAVPGNQANRRASMGPIARPLQSTMYSSAYVIVSV